MSRAAAVERTLATLRFFWNSPQGPEPDATGYQGFYYHFLDMRTGRRAWQCELSTVDSALLLAGALTAGVYFEADTADENEIRTSPTGSTAAPTGNGRKTAARRLRTAGNPKADSSNTVGKATTRQCCCISWDWARPLTRCPKAATPRGFRLTDGNTVTDMTIFTPGRCSRTSSRTSGSIFAAFRTRSCAPRGIDYFENSRRATFVQQQYAIDNPLKFAGYGRHCWGITASDGPGPDTIKVNGIERQFFDYLGRGVPYGPDDGTIAPWAVVASLPFAPEIVLPAIDYFIHQLRLKNTGQPLRLQGDVQSDLPGQIRQSLRLGIAVALRAQSGSDRSDDREPSNRLVVAIDAKLPLHRHRLAASGFWRGVVMNSGPSFPHLRSQFDRIAPPHLPSRTHTPSAKN